MRRWGILAAVVILGLSLTAGHAASDAARTFMAGSDAYRRGDWPAAIEAFQRVIADGIHSGPLYYNLGNAYLKNDDLGRALLWYERALKRLPDDPDLRFNYEYALTLTKDEPAMQARPLMRILFFWKYQLSPPTVRGVALILNAALWTALSILAVRRKRLLRPTTILTAAAAFIFTATAIYNAVETARIRHAIILPDQAAIRSGFTETATELFVLHAGTRVRVERESGDHLLIRYTADKIGWVRKADAGII